MSMSSVSVEFQLLPAILRGWFHCIKAFRKVDVPDYGMVLDVSDAYNTTKEKDLLPSVPPAEVPRPRGRKPITPRKEPNKPHGDFRAFGRALEVCVNMYLPISFKGSNHREYTIKIFPNKIQVPGCFDEDHRDVKKIVEFMFYIFRQGYANVPPPPIGMDFVMGELVRRGMQPLICMHPRDIDTLRVGNIEVYSRNYTFHYKPLVENVYIESPKDQKYVLNIDDINEYVTSKSEEMHMLKNKYGIEFMTIEYTGISETSNRRLQFIFDLPKRSDTKTNMERLTKAYLEASGKLNIDLGNNYINTDNLWRIFSIISHMIESRFIQQRMPTGSAQHTSKIVYSLVGQPRTDQTIREFISKQITPVTSDDEGEF
jgi:hypothetical protein